MKSSLSTFATLLFPLIAVAQADHSTPKAQLTLTQLQEQAAKFNSVLTPLNWESTPEQITSEADAAMASANRTLDGIGKLTATELTFENTVRALDDVEFELQTVHHRFDIIEQAHPDPKMRSAAVEAVQKLNDFAVGIDYREDVYRSVRAYAETKPQLQPVEQRLLDFTLRDYKRAGLTLDETKRGQVESLRKQIAFWDTHFAVNNNNASAKLTFSKDDLEGVPDNFLSQVKTGEDQYTVDANVAPQFLTVVSNCVKEETRKKLQIARDTRAKDKNLPIAAKVISLRAQLATLLGYQSWADYQTETRMAKSGANALDFLEKLKSGLQPKYDEELAEFKKIKAGFSGSTTPDIKLWDWYFVSNQLEKQRYSIDEEALRVYFPMDRVLNGMFAVYERIFGIKIEPLEPPTKYVDELKLYAIIDSATNQPLGLLYMDLFPRPGKYNHFATFSGIDGKLLADGKYQRPTAELICNFPSPSANAPSLLDHQEVTTIFHEFGHAMHAILTTVDYVSFSGLNVPQDFVEAPSQMLEYFTWDKSVLDSFAADYRDPTKKIPGEILAKLKEADLATKASWYRRQLSFAIMDLKLHMPLTADQKANLDGYANSILDEVFLPSDAGSAMLASFGHLFDGYDAGYYGYAWADAIAADMASVFQKSPDGFLDSTVGRRLRDEVYAVGNSRDVADSVEHFLGRKQSVQPFLKKVGIDSGTM
ncbi:MAG: Zn-dependent oligopeptidase [Verrucomicrobia bacterium]|nr:Zn-dependent oligopeptidase [Verrucomicrobiota bacterium]